MHSKNKKAMTRLEREHVGRIKALPCAVCDSYGGAETREAHEIKQGQWFTSVALCADCHRGNLNGLHGQRCAWSLRKMDEIDALAVTIERLIRG